MGWQTQQQVDAPSLPAHSVRRHQPTFAPSFATCLREKDRPVDDASSLTRWPGVAVKTPQIQAASQSALQYHLHISQAALTQSQQQKNAAAQAKGCTSCFDGCSPVYHAVSCSHYCRMLIYSQRA